MSKLSVIEVEKIFDAFQSEYNGNIPVKVLVVDRQEEVYGPNYSAAEFGAISGSYHGHRQQIVLVASSFRNENDVRRVIRHELFGHYGLNTF